MNLSTQSTAEATLRDAVSSTGASSGFSQGALVTIDPKTGEIVALVGGTDYKKSQFNRASQAMRQPGSTFKMFTYTAAIEQGISPGTAYSCAPLSWDGQFFEGCHAGGGSLDMYTGLALSENVIALRIAQEVGLDKVASLARRMGIQSKLNVVPGLVIGQSEVTPLEITGAYSVLANGGVRNRPHAIRRILDGGECKDRNNFKTCRVIYPAQPDQELNQSVLQPDVANTMTQLLQGLSAAERGSPPRSYPERLAKRVPRTTIGTCGLLAIFPKV